MKLLIVSMSIFFVNLVFALGPIPNGEYEGRMSCWSKNIPAFEEEAKLTLTNTTMLWASESENGTTEHLKTFIVDKNGYFTINPNKENGSGYFTSKGLHFEITIDGISGEDTFFYQKDELFLISSAKFHGELIVCEGRFTYI